MSTTTPGVNTGAPKAAAAPAAGHAGARASEGAGEDAGGFALLLSSMEAGELQDPALPETAAEPLTTDPARADAGAAALAWPLPAALQPLAPSAQPTADTALAGPRAGLPGAAQSASLQAWGPEAVAGLEAPSPQSEPAATAEPLLQQAELARRTAQQRAKALGAEAAPSAQEAQERKFVLQQALQAAAAQTHADGAAPAAAVTAQVAATGSELLRGWRAREDQSAPAASSAAMAVAGVDGAQAGSSLAGGAATSLPVPAAAPDAALLTEQRVAEQVSYWVRRGVHKAELELDGPGEGAVQVSIALQGQQARVEFRADAAQTRQLLEDSTPQLRELLAREGLVLADVSVGTSGGGRDPARDTPAAPPEARRQLRVELPLGVAAAVPARPGLGAGRALDLYV